MSTNRLTASEIQRKWHLIDAKNQPLGRLASGIAQVLMGKNKPNFVPYLDTGDNVVVVNAAKVKVTGKKEQQKLYIRHSGYPGGLRTETLAQVREKKPAELITHAVKGMVPRTKLGRQMIKKLHVFSGGEHPFKDKIKEQ
ncbi:MAG: 50S ribosomal protein L13 [Patescibacteria group bacterium]|nr:50S ribosomal protein L13 [Patescibacteria group bacterium]